MILGIDQSLTGTGLALLPNEGLLVKTAVVVTTPRQKWSERFKAIVDSLDRFLAGFAAPFDTPIEAVAMESYAFSSRRAFALGEVGGVIKWHLVQKGYEVHSFLPAHHKMFVSRRGDAEKRTVMADLARRFKINVTNNNAADAVALALVLRTARDYAAGRCDVSPYDKQLFERMGIFRGRTSIEIGIGRAVDPASPGSGRKEKRKVEPAKNYTRGPGDFVSLDEFERRCEDK